MLLLLQNFHRHFYYLSFSDVTKIEEGRKNNSKIEKRNKKEVHTNTRIIILRKKKVNVNSCIVK